MPRTFWTFRAELVRILKQRGKKEEKVGKSKDQKSKVERDWPSMKRNFSWLKENTFLSRTEEGKEGIRNVGAESKGCRTAEKCA